MMAFRIEWSIGEDEWEIARRERTRMPPGTTFATHVAAGYLLFGSLQMYDGENQLFPDELLRKLIQDQNESLRNHNSAEMNIATGRISGVTLSISDLATQLLRVTESDAFRSSKHIIATFEESDGSIDIRFAKNEDTVIITSELFDDVSLAVPTAEFLQGVSTFITEFASAVNAQAPELLDWESFAELRHYVFCP